MRRFLCLEFCFLFRLIDEFALTSPVFALVFSLHFQSSEDDVTSTEPGGSSSDNADNLDGFSDTDNYSLI